MHKDKAPISLLKSSSRSFTLVELIIVIIIVGILAAVGISQYSLTVEKSRLAEAKVRIGVMRQLAYEYYLNNGTMVTMTNADVGVDGTCAADSYYMYRIDWINADNVMLISDRCTGAGKLPRGSRRYYYYLRYWPGTGQQIQYCHYDVPPDACFGFPAGPY